MKNKKDITTYKNAQFVVKQNNANIILSTFVVYAFTAIALLLPFFNFGFACLVFAVLSVGLKNIAYKCVSKLKNNIEDVFLFYKHTLKIFILKICKCFVIAVYSIFFIIPGIVKYCEYIFAENIFALNTKQSIMQCLIKSKQYMKGFGFQIFTIFMIKFLSVIMFFCLFASIFLIINLYVALPLNFMLFACLFLVFVMYVVLIVPYYELFLANLFCDINKAESDK